MAKNSSAKKTFDCVETKRAAQARIYKRIKGLSPAQEIAYFRRAAEHGPLGRRWKALLRRAAATANTSHKRAATV